jgi:hypothetical protein
MSPVLISQFGIFKIFCSHDLTTIVTSWYSISVERMHLEQSNLTSCFLAASEAFTLAFDWLLLLWLALAKVSLSLEVDVAVEDRDDFLDVVDFLVFFASEEGVSG